MFPKDLLFPFSTPESFRWKVLAPMQRWTQRSLQLTLQCILAKPFEATITDVSPDKSILRIEMILTPLVHRNLGPRQYKS